MLSVGLTGSIAVGKSFVCGVFEKLGAHVMDADKIARDVVGKGTDGLKLVVRHFGKEIVNSDGELDRGKLASIVFSDEHKRQLLNSIVHPLVIKEQDRWLRETAKKHPDAICIVEAALMIESGGFSRFDKLIVVWCDPEIQLERLIVRNGLSRADALRRIRSQMPQEEKMGYADILIDTSEGFDAVRKRTKQVFQHLADLNRSSNRG